MSGTRKVKSTAGLNNSFDKDVAKLRKHRNRKHAKKSRIRKKKYLHDLQLQNFVLRYQHQNLVDVLTQFAPQIANKILETSNNYELINSDTSILFEPIAYTVDTDESDISVQEYFKDIKWVEE